ncbi:hypothetical protein CR513_01907, partial [Mucuna pruriens]
MDEQTKVVNRTLGQHLRCFVENSLRDWEDWIPHVEFAYNKVFNSTTSYSLFKLAYGFNLLSPLDLLPLPILPNCVIDEWLSKAKFIKRFHDKALLHMEKKGEKYAKIANKGRKDVFFKEGDLITQAQNLRSNSLQEGEDDAYMGCHTQGTQEGKNKVAIHAIEGPITRGGSRVFKRKCNMSWAWSRDKRRPKKAKCLI